MIVPIFAVLFIWHLIGFLFLEMRHMGNQTASVNFDFMDYMMCPALCLLLNFADKVFKP